MRGIDPDDRFVLIVLALLFSPFIIWSIGFVLSATIGAITGHTPWGGD